MDLWSWKSAISAISVSQMINSKEAIESMRRRLIHLWKLIAMNIPLTSLSSLPSSTTNQLHAYQSDVPQPQSNWKILRLRKATRTPWIKQALAALIIWMDVKVDQTFILTLRLEVTTIIPTTICNLTRLAAPRWLIWLAVTTEERPCRHRSTLAFVTITRTRGHSR